MITKERLKEIDRLLGSEIPWNRATQEEFARLAVFYAVKGIGETVDIDYLKGASDWTDGLIAQEEERRAQREQQEHTALLRDVLRVIHMTDPEHETFRDSLADAFEALAALQARIEAVIGKEGA